MIRNLDLRVRLLSALLLVASLSQVLVLEWSIVALGCVSLIALVLRPDPALWRRLLHMEAFVVLIFLMLPFTVGGHPLFSVGPLTASFEGVALAALIACKVAASVLVLAIFIGGVEPVRLGSALRWLRVPEQLVLLFLWTSRYLDVAGSEFARLRDAMRARGFRPSSNRHTWRSYGNLLGMMLVRALERAERVDEAMRCRGFSGRFPRPAIAGPTARDLAALALAVLVAVFLLYVGRL